MAAGQLQNRLWVSLAIVICTTVVFMTALALISVMTGRVTGASLRFAPATALLALGLLLGRVRFQK